MLKKYVYLSLCLLTSFSTDHKAMELSKELSKKPASSKLWGSAPATITEPYKPSISVRYPISTKIATSLAVGAGTYAVASCSYKCLAHVTPNTELLKYVAPVSMGILSYIYHSGNSSNLIDSILTDPSKVLAQGYSVQEKLAGEFKEKYELNKEKPEIILYRELVQKYESKDPLFLLGECTKEDWGACLLSRNYQPRYRRIFAERASVALTEKIQTSRNPVEYTSFGCGGALQDLIIIAKTLANCPNAQLNINLIDGKNTPYVVAADFCKHTRTINPHNNFDLGERLEHFTAHLRKLNSQDSQMSKLTDAELQTRIRNGICEVEPPYQQFIGWLQKIFPRAELSLLIHDTTKGYLGYVQEHQRAYPDVITTADIQDEMSLLYGSTHNYGLLCREALRQKPAADTIWLAKNSDGKSASLRSISLENVEGAMKETLEIGDQEVPIYIKNTVI